MELEFCELPNTPSGFDIAKFKAGDPKQQELYAKGKCANSKTRIPFEKLETTKKNFARIIPDGCMFIDFDIPSEADIMYDIIMKAKLRCLILKTTRGYHFLFRTPTFFESQKDKAINWFGYKFDTKAGKPEKSTIQVLKICGMMRDEVCSWKPDELICPKELDPSLLDVLPYWLWGYGEKTKLYKERRARGKFLYYD